MLLFVWNKTCSSHINTLQALADPCRSSVENMNMKPVKQCQVHYLYVATDCEGVHSELNV